MMSDDDKYSPTPVKYKRGMNPTSQKNLKPYKKGSNGNPGNPFPISRRLKQMLEENSHFLPPNANPSDKNYAEQIARQMLVKATCGDTGMVRELLDRTEGKVTDTHKFEGEIVLRIIDDESNEEEK